MQQMEKKCLWLLMTWAFIFIGPLTTTGWTEEFPPYRIGTTYSDVRPMLQRDCKFYEEKQGRGKSQTLTFITCLFPGGVLTTANVSARGRVTAIVISPQSDRPGSELVAEIAGKLGFKGESVSCPDRRGEAGRCWQVGTAQLRAPAKPDPEAGWWYSCAMKTWKIPTAGNYL